MKSGYGKMCNSWVLAKRTNEMVQIFEQSQFASELGAAVHLAPNANGILKRLGIDAEDFGSNPMQVVSFRMPDTAPLEANQMGVS